MTPLWIYQQRRSALGGHKLIVHVVVVSYLLPLPIIVLFLISPLLRVVSPLLCTALFLVVVVSPPISPTFLLLLAVSLPLSSSPRFVFPSLRHPRSSNSLPLRRPSSSCSTFLLPADSPPGFESPLPLGTRCRWVRLPVMCRSRSRCRCRRPFAGIASSGRQVVVAATMWVVDAVWGLRSLGVGWGLGKEVIREERATTRVVAHFRDALDRPPTCWVPPCVSITPIPPSSNYVPAHIPWERGGAGAAVVIPDS